MMRVAVNGQWRESASEQTALNVNPADTDDVIGTVRLATREEARAAHADYKPLLRQAKARRFSRIEDG